MRYFVAAILAAGSLTSACTPMRQAALVYSSSVDVGVNVAAGTPSNPGIDLSLGYSQDDAAYVPVVVANECRGEPGETCNGEMMAVLGNNDADSTSKPAEQALADAARDLGTANAAQAEAAAAERSATTLVEQNQAALRDLQAVVAKPAVEGQTVEQAQAPDPARVAEAQTALDQARSVLASATAASGAAQERVRQAAAHQAELTATLDQTDRQARSDALSVFGSFNGDVNARAETGGATGSAGPSANGGMNLGKTFSTGVASQLLTEGVRDSMVATSMAQCLEQAARNGERAPEANRATVTETLSLACARNASRFKR